MLAPDGSFVIDATVHSDGFSHSHFAALKLKDAIVDRFRGKTGKRPSIDKVRQTLRLNLHISGEKVTISVDASGEQLSRRGIPSPNRQGAPQRSACRWIARPERVAPRHAPCTIPCAVREPSRPKRPFGRRDFQFRRVDVTLPSWIGATSNPTRGARFAQKPWPPSPRLRRPFSRRTSIQARCAKRWKASKAPMWNPLVQVKQADFFKLEPRTDKGMLVFNPPYGERMDPGDVVGSVRAHRRPIEIPLVRF